MYLSTDDQFPDSSFIPHPSSFPSRCGRCGDLGLWLTPSGLIDVCPSIQMQRPHTEPNAAALFVARAARSLAFRDIKAHPHAFSVARALTRFTTTEPCPRQLLIDRYFEWAGSQSLRHLHSVIEDLRRVWLLPVGSRKSAPHGYWICTDQADFEEYFQRAAASPRTQLGTIFRVAKANWPVYGEQIELDFWKDMTSEAGSGTRASSPDDFFKGEQGGPGPVPGTDTGPGI